MITYIYGDGAVFKEQNECQQRMTSKNGIAVPKINGLCAHRII